MNEHNHVTREIRPPGAGCPGCDAYWARLSRFGIWVKQQQEEDSDGAEV